MAAAVLFDYDALTTRELRALDALNDSKQHSSQAREELYPLVMRSAARVVVVSRCVRGIDARGLHKTNLAALRDALRGVTAAVGTEVLCLVDGFAVPEFERPQRAIVDGDATSAAIAAASIIAKVTHDRYMHRADRQHPGWGFAEHVGYSTPVHRAAILRQGVSPLHRMSFQSLAYQQTRPLSCPRVHRGSSDVTPRGTRTSPGALDVLGPRSQPLRVDEHADRIEADLLCAQARTVLARQPRRRKSAQPQALRDRQRRKRLGARTGPIGSRGGPPGLDLGEDDRAPVACDQVDLAVAGAYIARDLQVAASVQVGRGKVLAAAPEASAGVLAHACAICAPRAPADLLAHRRERRRRLRCNRQAAHRRRSQPHAGVAGTPSGLWGCTWTRRDKRGSRRRPVVACGPWD